MTIQCPHCRVIWRGKPGMHGGRSRVVETRTVSARTTTTVRNVRTMTVQRLRECLTCRWRWRTREVMVPIKKMRREDD
jgi:hypothetical protein